MERDPVCGMEMRPGQEEASFTWQDTTYRFCSHECCERFKDNSKQFVKEMETAQS